jgi:hypothetical protein
MDFNTSFHFMAQRNSVHVTNIRFEVLHLCPNKTKTNSTVYGPPTPSIICSMTAKLLTAAVQENIES